MARVGGGRLKLPLRKDPLAYFLLETRDAQGELWDFRDDPDLPDWEAWFAATPLAGTLLWAVGYGDRRRTTALSIGGTSTGFFAHGVSLPRARKKPPVTGAWRIEVPFPEQITPLRFLADMSRTLYRAWPKRVPQPWEDDHEDLMGWGAIFASCYNFPVPLEYQDLAWDTAHRYLLTSRGFLWASPRVLRSLPLGKGGSYAARQQAQFDVERHPHWATEKMWLAALPEEIRAPRVFNTLTRRSVHYTADFVRKRPSTRQRWWDLTRGVREYKEARCGS